MLLRETIQFCAVCESTTPHSRRRVSIPRIFGFFALVLAGWCFLSSADLVPLGMIPLAGAIVLLVRDRRKRTAISCERCRAKQVAEERAERERTGPKLGRNSEISIL